MIFFTIIPFLRMKLKANSVKIKFMSSCISPLRPVQSSLKINILSKFLVRLQLPSLIE